MKIKVAESDKIDRKVLCNVVLDEMAIRKQIEWTGEKMAGLVNVGSGIHSNEISAATQALFFMLVAINAHWKIPVGYFLLNSLSASE